LANLCPLCNGLKSQKILCEICGERMDDGGQVENYYDPYSGYEDDLLVKSPDNLLDPNKWCLHNFICPDCGHTFIKPIKQLSGPHYFG